MRDLFFFDATEDDYDVSGIEGSIPAWVRGSYYINGPARFQRGQQRYTHWLDGDGMVCALHFTERGVRFVSRFVRTRKTRDEDAAGAFLYRGFGTAFPGDRLLRNVMLESPVNINVCVWDDKLIAFGEQSLPVELHRETLDTIGEFDCGGALNEVTPFSAHAKVDHRTGAMLNFGISHSARQPMLNYYELATGGEEHIRRRFPIAMQHSNHDFHFTARHAVFFLSPLIMDFDRFLRGAAVMDSLSWEPERRSRIMVLPRNSSAGAAFEADAGVGYCLHLINAFERDDRLTLDILELERPVYSDYRPLPELFADASRCSPVRYTIDLSTRCVVERVAMSYDLCCDFPAIDPHLQADEYNDFWVLGISKTGQSGAKFFDQIARGSWKDDAVIDTWTAPQGEYLGGEPVLIAHPGKDDASFVMVQHIDGDTGAAAFVMFRAHDVARGPIVRIPLRNRLHPLFHAAYYPARPAR